MFDVTIQPGDIKPPQPMLSSLIKTIADGSIIVLWGLNSHSIALLTSCFFKKGLPTATINLYLILKFQSLITSKILLIIWVSSDFLFSSLFLNKLSHKIVYVL